jgi:hypothetical protein
MISCIGGIEIGLRLLLLSTLSTNSLKLSVVVVVVVVEEEILIATTIHQSKSMLFRFVMIMKRARVSERFSTELTEKSTNILVHRSNVLVELATTREQQATENALILLQLLVNSSHTTTQVTARCRRVVALLASKTNPLVNRSNVVAGDCGP